MTRGALLAAALCVAGAALLLVAVGSPWVVVDVIGSPLLPGRRVEVPGSELAPGLRALGLVGLAGVPALAATRGRGRQLVGLLLLTAGAAAVSFVLGMRFDDEGLGGRALRGDAVAAAGRAQGESFDLTVWSHAAVAGGLLLAGAGLLIALRGRSWSALGRRYEPPAPAAAVPDAPATERDLWAALDRGEDPTGEQDPPANGDRARD